MNLYFPYQFDGRGRTQEAALQDYLKQLVEQVLFTSPGERVNRPTFGSGALQLVFTPASDAVAAAVQLTVQAALQQTLGDLIQVMDVQAVVDDSTLRVKISYLDRTSQQRNDAEFSRTTK